MKYCEKIRPNLYVADIERCTIEPTIGHNLISFFIVEHISDNDYIRKQIRQLLVAGFGNFYFYGMYEKEWHFATDLEDILLNTNKEDEQVAITIGCESIDDFVEELKSFIDLRPIVPVDTYLFYDDKKICEKILSMI